MADQEIEDEGNLWSPDELERFTDPASPDYDPEFREVQTMETYPLDFVREDLLESSDERAIDDMLGHGTDSTTPVYEIRIKFEWNRQTRAAGTRQDVMHGFILKKMNVRGPLDR